ncbi:MAG: creatininase family protein, partial [Planctomycetales bacterium]|nr:creatininase family protein [Planctomycetales bacterium]
MLLWNMTWPQVDQLSRDTPVVIPIAAMEQHGPHLPISTDSILLGEIVRRAGEQLTRSALITPLQWLGNSAHHIDFP